MLVDGLRQSVYECFVGRMDAQYVWASGNQHSNLLIMIDLQFCSHIGLWHGMRDDVSRGVFVVQKPHPFAVKQAYLAPNWIGSCVRVDKKAHRCGGRNRQQAQLLSHLSLKFILKHRLQFVHGVVHVFVLQRSVLVFKGKTHGIGFFPFAELAFVVKHVK